MPLLRRLNTFSVILITLLISLNVCKSSLIIGCDPELSISTTADQSYEEYQKEFADEIDDVNDYMQIVADQLTKDGIVVVRAVRTTINVPETADDLLTRDNLDQGASDCVFDQTKFKNGTEYADVEFETDPTMSGLTPSGFAEEKSPWKTENLPQNDPNEEVTL
ncbi:uncharacterized protein LOC124303668 [Neodiprion virginianus]|uniref:uncharacterized protein LOC124303668 n=1 Tax=Neodiprion virginianus TaxID=2961670 RepID=UPI001EE7795A|nr:uncharacterized protein LOC124303668 [Neodiprion virginianus]